MHQHQQDHSSCGRRATPGIGPSGKIVAYPTIAKNALIRAVRYPVASLVGIGATLVTHAAIVTSVSTNVGLLVTSAIELFAGIVLFLVLTSLMVMNKNRLDHVGRLFRIGAIVSAVATIVATAPILLGLMLMPVDWQNAPQWQSLGDWWPTASIGFCVVATGCILPAFLIAWPISAQTGLPLLRSILFVWQAVEDSSYSSAKMSIFVGLVGWVLVTLPGAGLLAPVFFAHLSAALFQRLVIVGEQER